MGVPPLYMRSIVANGSHLAITFLEKRCVVGVDHLYKLSFIALVAL